MERYNSLNNNQHGYKTIVSNREDSLEKQMREQLDQLKRSQNIKKCLNNSSTTLQYDYTYHQGNRLNGIRDNSQSLNNSFSIQVQQNNKPQSIPDTQKNTNVNNNVINSINRNNLESIKHLKQKDKKNERAILQNCNHSRQQQNSERQNHVSVGEIENCNISAKTSRKRNNYNNFMIGHSYVESRYGLDSNDKHRGNYLFKKLKQKLEESEYNGYHQEVYNQNENRYSLQASTILLSDNKQPFTINFNDSEYQKDQPKTYQNSMPLNLSSSFQYNQNYRSCQKDEANNSILDQSQDYYQQSKNNSKNSSPFRLSKSSNYRSGNSQCKISNNSKKNNNENKNNSKKRQNSSQNQRYPMLIQRNNHTQINLDHLNQSHKIIQNNNNNKQENSFIMLKQQIQDQNQTATAPNQHNQSRRQSFIRKQQEIDNLFKNQNGQFCTIELEKNKINEQNILSQRQNYLNQQQNNFLIQLPQKDPDQIHQSHTQESQAFATQGSQQQDSNQPIQKMSAHQLLKNDEKIKFVASSYRKKLKQKQAHNVELVRIYQGENGNLVLQGDKDKDKNILSKNNFDQSTKNEKSTARSNSNQSSNLSNVTKKVKKINSRYIHSNQSVMTNIDAHNNSLGDYTQLQNLQNLQGFNNIYNGSEQIIFNSHRQQKDEQNKTHINQQNNGSIVIQQLLNNQKGSNQIQKERLSSQELKSKHELQSNNYLSSLQDKEKSEELLDLKIIQDYKQDLFKLQQYPLTNDNNESEENEQNQTQKNKYTYNEEEYENDNECDNNQNIRERQNSLKEDSNIYDVNTHYVVGQLYDTIHKQNNKGENYEFKNENSIDNYIGRKYNANISIDEEQENSVSNIQKKCRKKKNKKGEQLRGKIVLSGQNNKKYKIKAYKNVLGIYCSNNKQQSHSKKDNLIKSVNS